MQRAKPVHRLIMAGLLMLVLGFWASFKLKDPPEESAHPADQKVFSSVQSKANPLSPVVQTKPSQDVKQVIPTQSPPKPHNFSVADGGDAKPLDNSQEEAKYRRWSLIAKGSHLNLLGEEDLSLNEAVIALLELNAANAEILRKEVNNFVSAVKSEELKNAYVNSNASGDEEIVIKPFDPGQLMSDFLKSLEQSFDPATAKFVGDLAGYDGMLKSVGSEVRLAYETGMNGENRLRVDSEIRSRESGPDENFFVKDGITFSSKIKVNSSRILGRGNDSRYEALFNNVASLPKSADGSNTSLNYDNQQELECQLERLEHLGLLHPVDHELCAALMDTGKYNTPDPYVDIALMAPYAVNWQIKELTGTPAGSPRTDMKKLIRIVRKCGDRGYVPIETLASGRKGYDSYVEVRKMLAELNEAITAIDTPEAK